MNIALVIVLAIYTEGRSRFVDVDAVKAALWLRGSLLFLPGFCSLFIRFGRKEIGTRNVHKNLFDHVLESDALQTTLFRGVNEMHCVLSACECFPIWVKCCIKKFQRVFKICNSPFLLGASGIRSARLT